VAAADTRTRAAELRPVPAPRLLAPQVQVPLRPCSAVEVAAFVPLQARQRR
jgi:hypothetical protein